jgi:hypothetical protein
MRAFQVLLARLGNLAARPRRIATPGAETTRRLTAREIPVIVLEPEGPLGRPSL